MATPNPQLPTALKPPLVLPEEIFRLKYLHMLMRWTLILLNEATEKRFSLMTLTLHPPSFSTLGMRTYGKSRYYSARLHHFSEPLPQCRGQYAGQLPHIAHDEVICKWKAIQIAIDP